MATAAKIHTTTDTRTRSLELAAAAGLGPWSVKFVSLDLRPDNTPAVVRVHVSSTTMPFVRYRVVVAGVGTASERASCDCQAAIHGRPCRHAGAGLLYAWEVMRAYREAAATYADQMREAF